MNWKRSWRGALLVMALALFRASAQDVTLGSLLEEMTNYSSIAVWPKPQFTLHQCSSYDRSEVSPDKPGWFGNNDFSQYIREEEYNGRKEKVMMDADGPGCLARFWLTTTANKRGTLRIYLDGQPQPALTFSAFDLLRGDLNLDEPLLQRHPGYGRAENGGNTLMLPIPYARHCKVTWEEAGEGPRYYQIDYRTYEPGTTVRTFARDQLEAERDVLREVGQSLESPPERVGGKLSEFNRTIPSNKSNTLKLPGGPAAVTELEFGVMQDQSTNWVRELRALVIEMRFDGERTAWCPASDFFGSGVGVNPLQSWYRTVRADGTMQCRWFMPYAKSAQVRLVNLGGGPVAVRLRARSERYAWTDRSLHFHATWHYESGLNTPPVRDWQSIGLRGRGVYAGDTLALFNPVATWYGEGDEKIQVDGESLPSFLGTGMEDYYDFSFAPRGLMQTPFANQVRVDQPMTQGHNVLTRTRNLDGIPFAQSLNFDFELMSWKPTTLIYATTTYWYGSPGAKANISAQPAAAIAPIPTLADAIAANAPRHRPGAIECESLKVTAKSGDFPVSEQNMEPFGGERWSGGAQLLVVARGVGDYIEMTVPSPVNGARRVVLYPTQAPDYGQLRFFVNGQPSSVTFDGYAPRVQPGSPLELGTFTPEHGKFVIRVALSGANPAAGGKRYLAGLDYFILR